MAYEPYVTPEYYQTEYEGSAVPTDELKKALRQASRHIDSLTYNRIVGQGFSNLTPFQQDLIREVVASRLTLRQKMQMRSTRFCRATASTVCPCSLVIPGTCLQIKVLP